MVIATCRGRRSPFQVKVEEWVAQKLDAALQLQQAQARRLWCETAVYSFFIDSFVLSCIMTYSIYT